MMVKENVCPEDWLERWQESIRNSLSSHVPRIIRIIGDVHGKLSQYKSITDKCELSIQLGDFGFLKEHQWHENNIDGNKHKILFGNHDYYPMLNYNHSLGRFDYYPTLKMFTIAGAFSIDKAVRIEGLDWFREEEMSYTESLQCYDSYCKNKPRIVLSHDCPDIVRSSKFNIHDKSLTSSLMQACFDYHKPEIWIFGHHHESLDCNILGTNFRCLRELEYYDLEV